ncbi:unnamed protein product [Leptidea sinapis]|uniref:Uncharacterized protein n=1 Tax=Leptidea sinapis TaxID=189913 RepID=A0A5E4PX06_9NEOP|nr:unnamed protein product [Leptidea sinapis]
MFAYGTCLVCLAEGEATEEVDESKWQDRIAFRFDQIISFASTAMDDKRRRSDDDYNTSPDSGIGHGDGRPGTAPAAPAAPAVPAVRVKPEADADDADEAELAHAQSPPAHFKKRFFRRERWGPPAGTPPPTPPLDWERPPV